MRRWTHILTAAVAISLVACSDDSVPPLTGPDVRAPGTPAPSLAVMAPAQPADHYVVLFDNGVPVDFSVEVERLGGAIGIEDDFEKLGARAVSGIDDADASRLARIGGVRSVTRDLMVQWIPPVEEFALQEIEAGPSPGSDTDTDQSGAFFFNRFQWYLRVIEADKAWLSTSQGAGTSVAILDTGIDDNHSDTQGNVDLGRSTSVLTPGSSPCGPGDEGSIADLNFHGTFVGAEVVSNGLGMGSVAPDATLIGVKVLNCLGSGSFTDVVSGIMHAADVGADVINMSLGAVIDRSQPGAQALLSFLQSGVDYAVDRGVVVVASAGNDGLVFDDDDNGLIHIPSMLDDVLSVGATAPVNQMQFDKPATYTNLGEEGVDVMSPGGDFVAGGVIEDLILSACSTQSLFFGCGPASYLIGSGTSFASPLAAGTAAVAIAEGQEGDECVEEGAEEIGDHELFGEGRINVLGAVACEEPDDEHDDEDDDDDEGDGDDH